MLTLRSFWPRRFSSSKKRESMSAPGGGSRTASALMAQRSAGVSSRKPLVGRLVVLPLDPSPQGAVDGLETLGVLGAKPLKKLHPYGPEKPLDLSPPLAGVGPAVNQRDPQPGARPFQLMRAEGSSVI